MDIAPAHQALIEAYALHFANKPRATRNLLLAQRLLQEALVTPGAQELADTLANELHACEIAQKDLGREGLAQAHRMAREASLHHLYGRHFTGKPRQTRDLFFLDDIVQRFAELNPANAVFFTQERQAIQAAYNNIDDANKSGVLGACANEAFYAFEAYIAGLRPVACRPGLLQRLVKQLRWIESEFEALAKRISETQMLQHNLAIVGEHLANWDELLDQVRTRRSENRREEILAALAEAFDHTLDIAGQHEGSKAGWGQLCDRIDEIERQVSTLAQTEDEHLLAVACRDALNEFERQFDATAHAKEDL